MVGACASQRANGARSQGWGCPPLFPNAQSWLITASSQDQRNFTQLYSACCQNTIIIGLWFTTCDGCHDTTSPEKKKAYFGRRGLFRVPSISFLLSPIRNKILLRGGRKDKGEGTTSHTNMEEELKKPDKVLKALQALKPLFTRTAMDFTAGPCVQIQILQVLEYF